MVTVAAGVAGAGATDRAGDGLPGFNNASAGRIFNGGIYFIGGKRRRVVVGGIIPLLPIWIDSAHDSRRQRPLLPHIKV